jgi:hypothetical protein
MVEPGATYAIPRTRTYPASGTKRGVGTAGRCAAPIVQGAADWDGHPYAWQSAGRPPAPALGRAGQGNGGQALAGRRLAGAGAADLW